MRFLVFNLPTPGHIDPCLSLVAELIGRGHEVVCYLTAGYQAQVERIGATFRPTPEVTDDYFEEVIQEFNPLHLATQLLGTTNNILQTLSRQVILDEPDAIIYDSMCPWGHLSAQMANIPAIASMAVLELPPSYLLKAGALRMTVKLMRRVTPWIRVYRQEIRRLKQMYAIRLPGLNAVLNWPGQLTISYTTTQIHPRSKQLGGDYVFIGPPIPPDTSRISFPFDTLDEQRPLIYISLGTVFNSNLGFFQKCLTALNGLEYQVVMSLGRRLSIESLGRIPDNFIVRSYVPQTAILERASLYITHGGVNSTHQALHFGVPLLMVPQQLEHALIAARFAELGVGIQMRHPTARNIQQVTKQLMHQPSYRTQAARLAASFKHTGGVKRAADAIELLAQERYNTDTA